MSRAMWSGSIAFGLVAIPVKLHSAVKDRGVRFHQVDKKDRSRIRYKTVNATTGEEVPREEIVKCYEVAKDECVLIDRKELEKVAPEDSRTIEIKHFVDLAEIDPIYYNRPYYLVPDKGAGKPYRLLLAAMEKSGKVGVAKFTMRGTEYLAALRPLEGVLCLETMHFADEVVKAEELGEVAPGVKVAEVELKAAQQLIGALSAPFDAAAFPAEHRQRLLRLVEAKAEGGGAALAKPLEPEAEAPPRVLRLVDALKASLDEAGKKQQAKERPVRRRKSA